MIDQQLFNKAIHDAQIIICEFAPGPNGCRAALRGIIEILDNEDLLAAIDRLDHRFSLRWVTK